jgi:outer membrane protein TolC
MAADPPELDRLQAEALASNSELKAAGYQRQAADEGVSQAKVLPDPMIGVNYTNDGYGPTLGQRDMSVLNLTFGQTLPGFGKRALRGEAAQAAADGSAANVKRAELDVRAAVARAYWNLLADDELLRLNESLKENGRLIESAARNRYAAGLGSQTDVLRAQAELSRLDTARNALEAERAGEIAALNALRGRPSGEPLALTGALPENPEAPPESELLASLEARSPDLAALKSALAGDEAEVKLARADGRPDFTVMGGVGYRARLDPMWMVGVSINLPRRGRVGAEVRAASFRRQSDEARLEGRRRSLEALTRARLAALAARVKTVRLYAEGILPQDRLAFNAAVSDYTAGAIPFSAVLEAAAMLNESQSLWVRGRAAVLLAVVEAVTLNPGGDGPAAGGAPRDGGGMR